MPTFCAASMTGCGVLIAGCQLAAACKCAGGKSRDGVAHAAHTGGQGGGCACCLYRRRPPWCPPPLLRRLPPLSLFECLPRIFAQMPLLALSSTFMASLDMTRHCLVLFASDWGVHWQPLLRVGGRILLSSDAIASVFVQLAGKLIQWFVAWVARFAAGGSCSAAGGRPLALWGNPHRAHPQG